jgi:chemotaxis protein MotB
MTVTGTPSPAAGLEQDRPDLEHRPSYLDLLARPDVSSAAGQAWLVTFTDLIALMLAFFVLLFSMSQIEQAKWQGLVEALYSDLNTLRKVESFKPALDYQPDQEAVVPGADLDYLTPIIREQIAAHPLLAREVTIHRAAERLVISLPAQSLFGAGAAAPVPQAVELGSALVSVLRNLNNAVEVEARLERAGAASARHADWELALARAVAFTGILTRAGYTGRIVVRATAATGPASGRNGGPARSQGARLDVVIHEAEQEPR